MVFHIPYDMKKGLTNLSILAVLTMIAACGSIDKIREIKIPNIKSRDIKQTLTENKTIAISCNKGDINEYIAQGWKIKRQESQEVVCSWKAKRAKRNCDIDKDKGCRITVPDKMGEQIIYYLEKTSSIK